MNDRNFFPRFYDPEDKVMLYWQCYMQSAFNRLTNTQHFGLLYNLLRNPNIIVMRCTGLRDKNGKLIFEGDILKSGIHYYQVVWHEGKFVLNKGCKNYPIGGCDLMEIIGNIHENPELLEAI